MIKNYLIVSFRTLFKHKFYSLINILGLSIGLTCVILLSVFVIDEFKYDRHFTEADQVYRMDFTGIINGSEFVTALMSAPAGQSMVDDYPEVIDAFRFRSTGNWFIKQKGKELTFKEKNVIYADPNFFTFWDTPLLYGDRKNCLSKPNSLVLDRSTATKIFGSEDPVGKTVVLDNEKDYEVTGVYEDFPSNSHFHFNVILTMLDQQEAESTIWMSFNFNTYLKLASGVQPSVLTNKFPELMERKLGPEIQRFMDMSLQDFENAGNFAEFNLVPLTEIHLQSDKLGDLEANGNLDYVYIFSAVGLFILILACINFMNLATARSANRAKEVGLRKVMGAFRGQLIGQFISEAILISVISSLIAVGLSLLLLAGFNTLSGKELMFDSILNPEILLLIVGITILVGFAAGSYPAFYLSKFRPAETLKGPLSLGAKSGGFRSALVVLQFTVSIIMIISTLIIFNQLSFIQNKKLGFNKDQVLMIHDAWILDDQIEAFRDEAVRDARISSSTIASFLPVNTSNNNNVFFPGKNAGKGDSYLLNNHTIDHDYLKTLGIEIVNGRGFSKDFKSDSTAVLLNESAVKQMGLTEPINSYLSTFGGDNEDELVSDTYKVVGVVKDFHFKSLKENIEPLIFTLGKSNGFVSFKLNADNADATIKHIQGVWDQFAPGQPFAYSFLNERFDRMYASERKIGEIFGTFAFLAIFIACLGLFGLASFTAEQRRKEIGIRKVLGASVGQIVNKLSFNFIKLVVLSLFIAAPVAYYVMQLWLADFAYRTAIDIWAFLFAGVSSVLIAWLTMGVHSYRAATTNPVSSLRNE